MSTVVLDQFETDYKESYVSGTYDQVMFGRLVRSELVRGVYQIRQGNRGVVYGSINARSAPQPGTSGLDRNGSVSYRSQPYYEKAGNCRASRHFCYDERIYDTLVPDILGCFRVNGASPFAVPASLNRPGNRGTYAGGPPLNVAMIMFDKSVPPSENYTDDNLNVGVDKHWTKAFPFEPKYARVARLQEQRFSNIDVRYQLTFTNGSFSVEKYRKSRSLPIFMPGFVGPTTLLDNFTYVRNPPVMYTGRWKHFWVSDVNLNNPLYVSPSIPAAYVTSSANIIDLHKVLYGFGDLNTTFFTGSYLNSEDETGYQRMGTNNAPDFRRRSGALFLDDNTPSDYDNLTGSLFFVGPVIRGWKYGLHSGLEQYTSAYFRQGRFGQFRDMLEQRAYTKFIEVKREKNLTAADAPAINAGPSAITFEEFRNSALQGKNKKKFATKTTSAVVKVSFVDDEGNITNPALTAAQNLSFEATSSLPYFDLQFRNRTTNDIARNIKLVNLSVDQFGNIKL